MPTIPNPYGYNDPNIGNAMTNIAQILFANGPNKQAETHGSLAYLDAQSRLARAKADSEKADLVRGYAQDEAMANIGDILLGGADLNNAETRARIAAQTIMSGKDGPKIAGQSLYINAGPNNEGIARFMLPFVSGQNVGMDQFATTPGAEAGRAKKYAHETAMNDADNAALLERERFKADNPKATTPIDITPVEAIRMQDLISYNLGAEQPEHVDPMLMNDLTDRATRYYMQTRNAGEAVARAIRETPVESYEEDRPGLFSGDIKKFRPAPAAAATPANIPPPAQRVRGQVYQTPRGPMVWTGTGWVPPA